MYNQHPFNERDKKLIENIDQELTSLLKQLPGVKSITLHNKKCYESLVYWSIKGEYESKHYAFIYSMINAIGIDSNKSNEIKHNHDITIDMIEAWLIEVFESDIESFKHFRNLMLQYCRIIYAFYVENRQHCELYYENKAFVTETLQMLEVNLLNEYL